MSEIDKIFSNCRELVEDVSRKSLYKWKEEHPDKKIVGYFPVYTPVEIIHAAGALPVAVFGGGNKVKTKKADSRLPSFICSIPRTSLEQGLRGDLDFLDAMLFQPICDVCRNLIQIWHRALPEVIIELLYLPQNIVTSGTEAFIKSEYNRVKNIIEKITNQQVDEKALINSINIYNKQRQLIRDLYQMRRETPWLVSASESYVLLRAGTMMPVEDHIPLLEKVLKEAVSRKIKHRYLNNLCDNSCHAKSLLYLNERSLRISLSAHNARNETLTRILYSSSGFLREDSLRIASGS